MTTSPKARLDVLVVDDDPAFARSTRRQLTGQCDVRMAFSAADARVEMTRQLPDVVLCDFFLVHPEHGDTLLRWAKACHPAVRRILYSGSEPHVWQHVVEAGLTDAVLTKPATLAEVLGALRGGR